MLFDILFSLSSAVVLGSITEYYFHRFKMHHKVEDESPFKDLSVNHLDHHEKLWPSGETNEGFGDDKGIFLFFQNYFTIGLAMLPAMVYSMITISPWFPFVILFMHTFMFVLTIDAHIATHYKTNVVHWCPKWYYNLWSEYHMTHHKKANSNFGFIYLFVADFLFGTLEWRNRDVYLQSKVH